MSDITFLLPPQAALGLCGNTLASKHMDLTLWPSCIELSLAKGPKE